MTSQSSGEKGIVFYNNDNEAQLALCLEENKSGTHLVLYKKWISNRIKTNIFFRNFHENVGDYMYNLEIGKNFTPRLENQMLYTKR